MHLSKFYSAKIWIRVIKVARNVQVDFVKTGSWALEHRCIFFFLCFLGCILHHNQVNAGFKHMDQHCDSMLIVHSLKFWRSVSHLVVCWSFNSWEWKPQADTIQCGVLSDVSCYIVALAPSINTHAKNKKNKKLQPQRSQRRHTNVLLWKLSFHYFSTHYE